MIIESIRATGQEFYYIPRILVAPDDVFGEDNLSKFKNAYQIEGYLDNIDNFGGQGSFMSKFGMFIEEQGQITISKRRWEQLVGSYGDTIIPSRPCEGDLIWFPLPQTLFEIKFVEHQNPFYQLGRLYVYKLKVETFQYSSERIDTDIDELNQIAMNMTFDLLSAHSPLPEQSNETISDPNRQTERVFGNNTTLGVEADKVLNFDETNPFGE